MENMEVKEYEEIVRTYCEADLPVFPIKKGEKNPMVNWSHFRDSMEFQERFKFFNGRFDDNVAMAAGRGLHLIDIDLKYDKSGNLFGELVSAVIETQMGIDILNKLVIVKTRSKGVHWWYKNPAEVGSRKLAMRYVTEEEKLEKPDEKVKVLIETRGDGGYALVYPSEGYVIEQGDLFNVPELTDEEMVFLLSTCERFNEVIQESSSYKRTDWNDIDRTNTPMNVYNLSGQMEDLLLSHGWKIAKEYGDRIYYTRPGKDKGISADYHKELNCLKVWSTSTEFESDRAMSPFFVYAVLEHNGDMSAAARALANQGFGVLPMKKQRDLHADFDAAFYFEPTVGVDEKEDHNMMKVLSSRWSIKNVAAKKEWSMFIRNGKKRFRVAGPGSIILIAGPPKTVKSTVLSGIIASALMSREFLNISFYNKGKKVIVFDTEQDETEVDSMNRVMYTMMETAEDQPNYHHYQTSDLTFRERADTIMKIVAELEMETPGDIGMIVIDGARDLIKDINDWGEASFLTDFLKALRNKTRACIATVMHQTKQYKFVRGAAGSELENKISALIEVSKEETDGRILFGVEVKYVRGASGVPKYNFFFNDNGMPVITGEESYADKTMELIEKIETMPIADLVRLTGLDDKDVVF
jgi:hypothetical protein